MSAESWIKREAEKRKELERQQQQKNEARASRVKKIAEKAPALWEKFAGVVENHVAEFNQLFRDDKQKLFEIEKLAPRTLLLKRAPYPSVRVELYLSLDTRSVNYQIVRTPRAHGKSSEEIGAAQSGGLAMGLAVNTWRPCWIARSAISR